MQFRLLAQKLQPPEVARDFREKFHVRTLRRVSEAAGGDGRTKIKISRKPRGVMQI